MAFIAFDDPAAQIPPPSPSQAVPLAHPGLELSALEWRVVAIARHDSLTTLQPRVKRGWFARLILGPQPAPATLANERLEALRRLAVQAWHASQALPQSALNEARLAGYSLAGLGAVIDHIAQQRAAQRRLAA